MGNMKYRSDEKELMDDFTLEGEPLRKNLNILALINKWLGGNVISLQGIEELLRGCPKGRHIVIADLGCGNGDMLRRVAKLGDRMGFQFTLIGIDANLDTIKYARKLSVDFENISFIEMNIFSEEFSELSYDIVLSTLLLHHLSDEEILEILTLLIRNAGIGIVVNDLQRSQLSHFLFGIISLFINNRMVRNDGLVSIRRGFKKQELLGYAKALNVNSSVEWKWAFRYRWIMKTNLWV
jgi:hypothetical protein